MAHKMPHKPCGAPGLSVVVSYFVLGFARYLSKTSWRYVEVLFLIADSGLSKYEEMKPSDVYIFILNRF